jgi:hypothetical protein
MKLSRDKLKQIIKEELEEILTQETDVMRKNADNFGFVKYNGEEYAAMESPIDLNSYELFNPETFESEGKTVLKIDTSLNSSKTNYFLNNGSGKDPITVLNKYKKHLQKPAPIEKPKPKPKWAKGYI